MLETEFLKLKYHSNVESNTDKVDAEEYFNNNYKKIDANAKKNYEDLIKLKADLEQENTDLANNMPWNQVSGKSLHITDSAKYSKNKLEISGDLEQEKRSGKNKCPNTLVSGTSNGITYTVNTNGSIKLSGTATAQTELKLYYNSTKPITFKAGKYKNTSNLLIILHGSTYYGINANSTITFSEDVSIYDIYFRINNGVTINETYYPQIINTSITTDETYEQYGATPSTEFPSMPLVCSGVQNIKVNDETLYTIDLGTTQLCAIKENGNVVAKDGPVYRNGKWQWEKNIGKYTFTGVDTDGYDFNSDNTDTLAVNLIINKKYEVVKKFNNVLSMCCDKFNFINNVNDIEHIYITSATTIENGYKGNIRLYINKDRLSGYNSSLTNTQKANLVKTWLQSNPITVYYILVTPEYIECTAEQSTVLDKLYNNFELQRGVNNIIIESENGVGINMELTYMQNNNLKHDKDIAELKQAIVALGGVI